MDVESLKVLFAPFGAVSVRRMFGGAGIYADGLCFAIAPRGGDVYIKCDVETQATFTAAGSQPFVYEMRGQPKTMAFWRLPAEAYDDEDALNRWAQLGLDAARRAAAAKAAKAAKPAARRKSR